ncbi:hypothetical protein Syun_029847 [Stephania yunnanensis]|uniref:Uncharacterized protein n=1 Tax=Stephania yunnanensis TaxID=152371 RepID=A0AAP0E9D3_9MAGN
MLSLPPLVRLLRRALSLAVPLSQSCGRALQPPMVRFLHCALSFTVPLSLADSPLHRPPWFLSVSVSRSFDPAQPISLDFKGQGFNHNLFTTNATKASASQPVPTMPSMMDCSQSIPRNSPKSRAKILVVQHRGGGRGGVIGRGGIIGRGDHDPALMKYFDCTCSFQSSAFDGNVVYQFEIMGYKTYRIAENISEEEDEPVGGGRYTVRPMCEIEASRATEVPRKRESEEEDEPVRGRHEPMRSMQGRVRERERNCERESTVNKTNQGGWRARPHDRDRGTVSERARRRRRTSRGGRARSHDRERGTASERARRRRRTSGGRGRGEHDHKRESTAKKMIQRFRGEEDDSTIQQFRGLERKKRNLYRARMKAAVLRQDVVGEPTRAQRRAEVAATSTSPSAPADRGKKRPRTYSYRKEKQQATQTSSVRGHPSLGDVVEAEASIVPVGSRKSRPGRPVIHHNVSVRHDRKT